MEHDGRSRGPSGFCGVVAGYLDRFLTSGKLERDDLNAIALHAGGCSSCYQRMSDFFRLAPLPDSSFLRETLDELAGSLLNLARAVIRDRPPQGGEDEASGVRITDPGGGSAEDNLELGAEMIEEAEDYSGSSLVGTHDLRELKRLLADAEQARGLRIDLALQIFSWVTRLDCRYHAQAWNWIGALLYKKGSFGDSKRAFLQALGQPEGQQDVRSFANCTLAYIYKHEGDLDRAVAAAHRSQTLAAEDGKDRFFGLLAEIYTRLLRGGPGDGEAARERLSEILALPSGRERLREALQASYNEPILRAFEQSGLRPAIGGGAAPR